MIKHIKFCDTCEKCLDEVNHYQLLGSPVDHLFCNIKCLNTWVQMILRQFNPAKELPNEPDNSRVS